jgi:hypothetical protein
MFEDLIPAPPAEASAPPPGMFDDLVPADVPAAITDIPREVAASTGEAWENVRRALPSSLGGQRDMAQEGSFESLRRTGQGLLAAATLPFAPIQGVARSLLGHPMVEADKALRRGAVSLYGEDKVRAAEQASGTSPGGMTYDEARRNADTVLSLLAPRGGLGVVRRPVQPAPPPSPPPPPPPPTGTVSAPGRELPPLHEGTRITAGGPHGPVLDGYQGRWADAVDWLRRAQTGDARGVLTHPEVPDPIDVIWGNERGGLQHILQNHPEVAGDLPQRLERMRAVSASANRIVLEGGDARAVIRQAYDGEKKTWLLTAYETRREGGRTESPSGLPGPTRSSTPPGGDNVGSRPPDNKFETAPALPSQQQIADNRAQIGDSLSDVGIPADRVDPADIEGAARLVTRSDLLTFGAFKRAVIGDALKRGFATPEEIDQAYGTGTADEYRGTSPPATEEAASAEGPAPPRSHSNGEQSQQSPRERIESTLDENGVPPDRVDPADIEGAARLVTRRDLLTLDAFKRAVIGDALKRGLVTPEEVDQAYGRGTADEHRGPSTPPNGEAAPAESPAPVRPDSDAPQSQ